MTAKHTPGPWYEGCICCENGTCKCTAILCEDYAGSICQVTVGNGLKVGAGGNDAPPIDEARANSHLIAKAPDLLAALEESAAQIRKMLIGAGANNTEAWSWTVRYEDLILAARGGTYGK